MVPEKLIVWEVRLHPNIKTRTQFFSSQNSEEKNQVLSPVWLGWDRGQISLFRPAC